MTRLEDVSNSDDLNQRIALPFAFPFLGVDRFEAFVGANGYVQFDSTNSPPCISQLSNSASQVFVCFMSEFSFQSEIYRNNFNSSYFGMIAAFTTDLYPPWRYPKSYIAYNTVNSTATSGADTLYIHFNELPFYNYSMSRINNTFHVRLKSDGSTTIFYEKVNYETCAARSQSGCDSLLISGLRASYETSYFTPSDAQKKIQSRSWATTIPGVYPPLMSLVKSQSMFHLCPFSDNWCMTPRVVQAQATVRLNISTLSVSCGDRFSSYLCSFTLLCTSNSCPTYTSVATLYNGGASSKGPPTFRCTVHASAVAAAVNVSVNVLGIVNKTVSTSTFLSSSVYSANPVPSSFPLSMALLSSPLVLRVLATTPALPASTNCQASAALTAAAAGLANTAGSCAAYAGPCAASSAAGISCLKSQATCSSFASLSRCDGTCHSPQPSYAASSNPLNQYLLWGVVGACCDASLLDCAGECKGGRKVAVRYAVDELKRKSRVCCTSSLDCDGYCGHANAPQLDCAGVCGGSASVDHCGVCSGGTTNKPASTCKVTYKFNDNLLNSTIPFVNPALSHQWVKNTSGVATRNVTLHNTAPISVTVKVSMPDEKLDPLVSFSGSVAKQALSEQVFLMASNSTVSFAVRVSLARTFQRTVTGWVGKYIAIEYTPDSSNYKATTKAAMQVATVVPNCNSVTDHNLCMALPLCMWCQATSVIKRSGSGSGSSGGKTGGKNGRSLFNLISPNAVEPNFEASMGSGFCASGWDQTTACYPYESLTDDLAEAGTPHAAEFVALLVLAMLPVALIFYLASCSPWSHLL